MKFGVKSNSRLKVKQANYIYYLKSIYNNYTYISYKVHFEVTKGHSMCKEGHYFQKSAIAFRLGILSAILVNFRF